MAQPIIITIDGPAGAGKSTTARKVAGKLGYVYVDTGAMYRAVTLALIRSKMDATEENVVHVMEGMAIELINDENGQRTFLNGDDVTENIRHPSVTALVSTVAAFPRVRRRLVQRQREMGLRGGIVMDGRDIGSVVFPNAHVKVFLIADIEERTKRRLADLKAMGDDVDEDELMRQILERDKEDSERDASPLIQPEGAHVIDTTHMTIDEQVDKIVTLARKYLTTEGLISHFGNL